MSLIEQNLHINIFWMQTKMHSSRMRTARSLTVSRRILRTAPLPEKNHARPQKKTCTHIGKNHARPWKKPHTPRKKPCMPPRSNHAPPPPRNNHACPPPWSNHSRPPRCGQTDTCKNITFAIISNKSFKYLLGWQTWWVLVFDWWSSDRSLSWDYSNLWIRHLSGQIQHNLAANHRPPHIPLCQPCDALCRVQGNGCLDLPGMILLLNGTENSVIIYCHGSFMTIMSVADPGFSWGASTPIVGVLTFFFGQKLYENERVWTLGGGGGRTSLASPYIRHCMCIFH